MKQNDSIERSKRIRERNVPKIVRERERERERENVRKEECCTIFSRKHNSGTLDSGEGTKKILSHRDNDRENREKMVLLRQTRHLEQ